MNSFRRIRGVLPVAMLVEAVACGTSSTQVDASDAGAYRDDGAVPTRTSCSGDDVITFKLVSDSNPQEFCTGAGVTCESELVVTVKTSTGQPLGTLTGVATTCLTLCENGCDTRPCPHGCYESTPVFADGVRRQWDGTVIDDFNASCSNGMSCARTGCAKPGEYVATMCAYPIPDEEVRRGDDAGAFYPFESCKKLPAETPPTCVDVPFTWPAPTGTIVLGTVRK